MPSNADLTLYLVSAGSFNVYYNTNPSGDWGDPASFSQGKLIATFKRDQSLFPLFKTYAVHALSETLESGEDFTFNGKTYNFNRMTPGGITFASFLSGTPQLTGRTDYPVAFAASGTVTAVGKERHW